MGGRGRQQQIRRREPSKVWRTFSPTTRPAALQRQGQPAATHEHASETRHTSNRQGHNLRITPHVKILSLMSKFTEEQTSTKISYRGLDLDQKQERETSMGGSSSIKTPTPTPKQPRQSHRLFKSPKPKAKRDRRRGTMRQIQGCGSGREEGTNAEYFTKDAPFPRVHKNQQLHQKAIARVC